MTTQFTADLTIADLCNEIGPTKDPSRWNPFVAVPSNATGLVAVVVPRRLTGTLRLTGHVSYASDGRGLRIEASRRPRYGGLHVAHELVLTPAGTFRTYIELETSIGGPTRALISRPRIAAWHREEIRALTARVERHHVRHPPQRAHTSPRFAATEFDQHRRVSASTSGRTTQT